MINANNLQMTGSIEGRPIMEPHVEGFSGSVSTKSNMLSVKAFSENWGRRYILRTVITSIKIALLSDKICLLIPFGPLAVLVDHLTSHHGWVFFLSLLGIIPLAERLGWAAEQLAFYTGPTAGELVNAFGKATDLIISMCAMKHGILRVVQLSLLGSILSDMLLVLGFAFFFGGIFHPNKQQVFNKSNAVISSGLLLMAVMGLLFPAVLRFTHTALHFGTSELELSRFSSCILLIAYGLHILLQLTSQKNSYIPFNEETSLDDGDLDDEDSPAISKYESVIWLGILTFVIFVFSDYLVDTIEDASVAMDVPIEFISVILLPIAGNAAEHASAIIFAVKDKLIPFCVVFGWIIGLPLDLNFQLFETVTLFMTVLFVAFMLKDGTSNYFKGLMLVFCYLIVAASYFVHMDPKFM